MRFSSRVIHYRIASKAVPSDNHGIGDVMVSLPILGGLRAKYPGDEVRLVLTASPYPWGRHFYGNTVLDCDSLKPGDIQLHQVEAHFYEADADAHRLGLNRVSHIAARLGVEPVGVSAPQATEFAKAAMRARIGGEKVVVIAPFALSGLRTWPLRHWLKLRNILDGMGYKVVGIGSSVDKQSFELIPGTHALDKGPEDTCALMSIAACVVGNDSGMMHVAGTFGVPAVALCGPTQADVAFGFYPSVKTIQAPASCSGCLFSATRGFAPHCKLDCDALNDLKPEAVVERIVEVMK